MKIGITAIELITKLSEFPPNAIVSLVDENVDKGEDHPTYTIYPSKISTGKGFMDGKDYDYVSIYFGIDDESEEE